MVIVADGSKIAGPGTQVPIWYTRCTSGYLGTSQAETILFQEGTEWRRDGKDPAFDAFTWPDFHG